MERHDDTLVKEITERLVAEFGPEEIYLFGSHAWGTPQEDSDVDVLVIVSQSSEPPLQRVTRAYRSLRGVRAPMDILVKTRAEVERRRPVYASLTRQILDDGSAV